jgi:hypothetical protein
MLSVDRTLTATITPTDTANNSTATDSVLITVTQATPQLPGITLLT